MGSHRLPTLIVLPLTLLLLLAATSAAQALVKPGRTTVRAGQVRLVALDQASLAFAVGRSEHDCDHLELWNIATHGLWRFGKPGACTNLGSTGAGISAIGVSGNRVLWVRYNGGNERDWQLMTATTTQRTPRQLRFVPQDVELPSPFAIGDSTSGLGIPYAVGNEVVLLGTNGAAVFRHVDPAPIVAVTAGRGPGGAVVAVLRATGEIVLLRADGTTAGTVSYPANAVRAIALAPSGLIVQHPGSVEIRGPSGVSATAALPAAAVMTDFAEGRVLYTLKGAVRSLAVTTGKDTLVLKAGTGSAPVTATLDARGLGWARGRSVSFACAACVGTL
jgi:hypothetical protein